MEQNIVQLEECTRLLEQELVDQDSDIAELTLQLQSMEEDAKDTITSKKAHLAQTYTQDFDILETEYEYALVKTVRENEIM